MPTFVLPKEKKDEEKGQPELAANSMDSYRRRISIPVNKEILDAFKIEDGITVTLKGEVLGLRNNESSDYNDQSIEIEITEVSAYPAESDDAEEEGMETGYKGG